MADGQIAVNPKNGQRVILRGGQWVPLNSAPQGNTVQLPRLPNRVRQEDTTNTGGILNNQGQGIKNARDAATFGADVPKAYSDAARAGAEAALAGQAVARGGVGQETFDKDLARRKTAKLLLQQLGQVEQKFNRDFRGGGVLQSAREFMPNALAPKNQEFDQASKGMLPLLYALLPKTDSNPAAAQLAPYDQYVPSSGRFDNSNADAIKRTRQLALGVLADTAYVEKTQDKGFQQAVKMLTSNPSPMARKQYDEAAKRFGWPKTAAQILGGN